MARFARPDGTLRLRRAAVILAAGLALFACRGAKTPTRAEEACTESCVARAKRCNDDQCERGCRFILDRLVEHEGDNVLACVAKSQRACDDALWADCAAAVGAHADGGPPAPRPPEE